LATHLPECNLVLKKQVVTNRTMITLRMIKATT
jgi:hypothetical protein